MADVAVYGVPVPGCDGKAGMVALVPQSPSVNSGSGSDNDFSILGLGLAEWASFPWQEFSKALTHHLPTYSRPYFVRLTRQIHTTATFKHLRSELVAEVSVYLLVLLYELID